MKKCTLTLILVGLVATLIISLTACCASSATQEAVTAVEAVDLGSGLWFIDTGPGCQNEEIWKLSLLSFVKKHHDLKITSMYAANESGHGRSLSMFLVTEPKSVQPEKN